MLLRQTNCDDARSAVLDYVRSNEQPTSVREITAYFPEVTVDTAESVLDLLAREHAITEVFADSCVHPFVGSRRCFQPVSPVKSLLSRVPERVLELSASYSFERLLERIVRY